MVKGHSEIALFLLKHFVIIGYPQRINHNLHPQRLIIQQKKIDFLCTYIICEFYLSRFLQSKSVGYPQRVFPIRFLIFSTIYSLCNTIISFIFSFVNALLN